MVNAIKINNYINTLNEKTKKKWIGKQVGKGKWV